MKIISEEPWSYVLFQHDGDCILTYMTGGVAEVDRSICLTSDEVAAIHADHGFVKKMIAEAQRHPEAFKDREMRPAKWPQQMKRLILTVEDVFEITGRGLVVVPGPLVDQYKGPSKIAVSLERPDGSRCNATLLVQWVHQSPPAKEPRCGCILEGVGKPDVPVGTQVWPAS